MWQCYWLWVYLYESFRVFSKAGFSAGHTLDTSNFPDDKDTVFFLKGMSCLVYSLHDIRRIDLSSLVAYRWGCYRGYSWCWIKIVVETLFFIWTVNQHCRSVVTHYVGRALTLAAGETDVTQCRDASDFIWCFFCNFLSPVRISITNSVHTFNVNISKWWMTHWRKLLGYH